MQTIFAGRVDFCDFGNRGTRPVVYDAQMENTQAQAQTQVLDFDLTDFDEAPTVVIPQETMAEFAEAWKANRAAALAKEVASSDRPTRRLRALRPVASQEV
jgi:hypothetical protein